MLGTKTYQLVCSPVHRYKVDNVPDDVDVGTGNAIVLYALRLQQLARLVLIPRYILLVDFHIREQRMPQQSLIRAMLLLVIEREHESVSLSERLHILRVCLLELVEVVEDVADACECVEHFRDRCWLWAVEFVLVGNSELL